MSHQENSHLERAAEYWNGGQPFEAGKVIFEKMPNEFRPRWASGILRLLLARSGIQSSLFEQVLRTADQQRLWGNGHRAFSNLRKATLELLELQKRQRLTKEQELLAALLSLAEQVAKVTYNAARPHDEFDEDSGWWLAAGLKGFVDLWHYEEFSKAAWSALCFQEG
jgi:hypothetical protein